MADQPPAFYTTYNYLAYTVFDTTEPAPLPVEGVGGTLTLNADGTYAKRLNILTENGLRYYNQDGRFRLVHDSIRFYFTDRRGPDVQGGPFQYTPATRRLTITLLGYPAGNQGVYELQAPAPARPARKRRQR